MSGLFDGLAVGDTIITEELPPQTLGYRGLDHQPDPPRTPRAIQARRIADWQAQEPTEEELKAFCPHGNLLTIETCDEGCE